MGTTGKIFISHRRGDDTGSARRLVGRLQDEFPAERLSVDTDGIPSRLDVVTNRDERVARNDVLLAVIGRGWLEAKSAAGRRRLDDPNDPVRIGIDSALRQGKRVIPVLVDDADMPRPEQLPEPLQPFARCKPVRLTDERFNTDAQTLIKKLKRGPINRRVFLGLGTAGALVFMIAVVIAAAVLFFSPQAVLTAYVTAIVEFVKTHEAWAAPVVFALAFGESIAFVSLVLPFWGMLVAVGALLGQSSWYLFAAIWIAASVGAALGDWLSYWLGYHYHAQIARIWPLSRYPDLLPRGHDLFEKWGAWAIWIARFSGPFRASVPIVAGVVRMDWKRFQIANWGSAFLWALVLLIFGDVIGKVINYIYQFFSA